MIQYIKDFLMSLVGGLILIIQIFCIVCMIILSVIHAFVCFKKEYSDTVKACYDYFADIARECM